jgi:hypothetical protein
MNPQPNQPFTDLDTLSTAAAAQPGGLVGVQVFGSSSVMDDMALAAAWLAGATGGLLGWASATGLHRPGQGLPPVVAAPRVATAKPAIHVGFNTGYS